MLVTNLQGSGHELNVGFKQPLTLPGPKPIPLTLSSKTVLPSLVQEQVVESKHPPDSYSDKFHEEVGNPRLSITGVDGLAPREPEPDE